MPPPQAAKPTKHIFDAFNSSATGHQRADNTLSGSTSWRDSRNLKINQQFGAGAGGGKRVSDTVGAGSLDFGKDGRTANGGWVKGAKGLRRGGQQSIQESFEGLEPDEEPDRPTKHLRTTDKQPAPTEVVNPFTPFINQDGSVRQSSWTSHELNPSHQLDPYGDSLPPSAPLRESESAGEDTKESSLPQIFASLTFYINGSTAPLISDHRLKQIISDHGGRMSISLGRKSVTHVIIGRPSSSGGIGGGLAGSKLQKEISQSRGNSLNFVTAEWVVESVKAGKRLPESRFAALRLAPKGSGNLTKLFGPQNKGKG